MPTDPNIAIAAAWAKARIGRRWEKGATGPDSFDCWGLVRACELEVFSRELPIVNVDPSNARAVARAVRGHPLMELWPRQAAKRHGDVVAMDSPSSPGHVGVYLAADRGGILHCIDGGGVRFDDFDMIRMFGWQQLRYYRPVVEAPA